MLSAARAIPKTSSELSLRCIAEMVMFSPFQGSTNQTLSKRWVILTAENPWGEEFPHFINKQRNGVMRKALKQSMWQWIEGLGKADGYPDEVVFLVWGITIPEAVLMANQMEQSAIVIGVARGYAEVVELLTGGNPQ